MRLNVRNSLVAACFATSVMCSSGTFAADLVGYGGWQTTTSEERTAATDWNNSDYIRSTTITTDGTLTTKIIEDYKLGNDGYMYVLVLDGDHQDFFRFPYEYTPPPGGPPDTLGNFGDPGSGTFDPPDPTDFYNGAIDYGAIGAAPEPAAWLLLTIGIGGMGGMLRLRRRTRPA